MYEHSLMYLSLFVKAKTNLINSISDLLLKFKQKTPPDLHPKTLLEFKR